MRRENKCSESTHIESKNDTTFRDQLYISYKNSWVLKWSINNPRNEFLYHFKTVKSKNNIKIQKYIITESKYSKNNPKDWI